MTDVAIACQGGGAHTAFTAGALHKFLDDHIVHGQETGESSPPRIVALSGTSGGALCATLAWFGLNDAPQPGQAAAASEAMDRLEEFWLSPYPHGNSALLPWDLVTNQYLMQREVNCFRWQHGSYDFPLASPFLWFFDLGRLARLDELGQSPGNYLINWGQNFENRVMSNFADLQRSPDWLRLAKFWSAFAPDFLFYSGWLPFINFTGLFTEFVAPIRHLITSHVDFSRVPAILAHNDRSYLYIGLCDAMSGDFRNIEAGDADFGSEIVVASTVLPTNARGVIAPHTENCTTEYSVYWDGLYSENPPIASMLRDLNNKGVNVDQLWVIRINPRNRRNVPLSREEIDDRRNELAGNVSFEHGLAQARAMLGNKPIYECALTEDLPIESKVCRSPAFLRELFRMGQDQPWRQL